MNIRASIEKDSSSIFLDYNINNVSLVIKQQQPGSAKIQNRFFRRQWSGKKFDY